MEIQVDCFTLYKERKKDKVVKTQKLSKGKGSKYQMVFSSQLVFQPFEKKNMKTIPDQENIFNIETVKTELSESFVMFLIFCYSMKTYAKFRKFFCRLKKYFGT